MNKKTKNYLDKVIKILEVPYFYNMKEQFGVITPNQQKYVICNIFNLDVKTTKVNKIGHICNNKGELLYHEYKGTGGWYKQEYDENGNIIFDINCHGYWKK